MGRGHQMQWTKKRPSCLVFACFWKHLEMQEACTDRSPEVLSSCSSKCPVVLVLRFGLCHQLRIRQWLAKTQGCLGATHFLFKKCTLNQFGAWLWWAQQPASTNVPMTPGLNVFEAYWNVIPSGMVIFLSLHFKENGLASHPPAVSVTKGRKCWLATAITILSTDISGTDVKQTLAYQSISESESVWEREQTGLTNQCIHS